MAAAKTSRATAVQRGRLRRFGAPSAWPVSVEGSEFSVAFPQHRRAAALEHGVLPFFGVAARAHDLALLGRQDLGAIGRELNDVGLA